MKLHSVLLLAMFAAPALEASTIFDATSQTTTVLHTGDSLDFEIFASSFAVNANTFGLPRYPTDVSFAFISAPTSWTGSFSGALESADGQVSIDFGAPLTFRDGSFSGAGYQGPVSTLRGYLHLSPLLSQELFGFGSAVLTLRNLGPDLTLGLDPYTLRQDLYVSLAGGPLSVGGIGGSVNLESVSATPSAAPEPDSFGLLLGGGTILCAFSVMLAWLSRRNKPSGR